MSNRQHDNRLEARRVRLKRSVRRVGSTAAALLCLTACASKPLAPYTEQMPPTVMVTLDQAGVCDLRGQFRAALCPRVAADAPPCDEVLLRFPGETEAAPAATKALRPRYRIVFVPGFFNECVDRVVRPFGGVVDDSLYAWWEHQAQAPKGRDIPAQGNALG